MWRTHVRQPRPDSDPGFQVAIFDRRQSSQEEKMALRGADPESNINKYTLVHDENIFAVPSSLGSGHPLTTVHWDQLTDFRRIYIYTYTDFRRKSVNWSQLTVVFGWLQGRCRQPCLRKEPWLTHTVQRLETWTGVLPSHNNIRDYSYVEDYY